MLGHRPPLLEGLKALVHMHADEVGLLHGVHCWLLDDWRGSCDAVAHACAAAAAAAQQHASSQLRFSING